MRVTIKLFASFRNDRFSKKDFDFEDGTTIEQVLNFFQIPIGEVGVTMINGRHRQMNDTLSENDVIGIFPLIGGG